jgi:outer membrane biosynthesis protein TonB
MIPRTLVPFDAKPPAADPAAAGRRRPSTLDERTLIPPALPVVPLDGRTSIPASLPLDSIAARVIVPRDVKWELVAREDTVWAPLLPTEMDARVTVPRDARPPEVLGPGPLLPSVLVDPDIVTTGELHLMGTEKQESSARWNLVTRFSSGLLHALVILAVLFQPKLFPERSARREDMEIARQQLSYIFLPPDARNPAKVTHSNEPRSEKLRIDPRILRKLAPPEAPPQPLPGPPEPERVVRELPNAPTPKPNVAPQPDLSAPAPKTDFSRPTARLEPPDQPQPNRGLILPKVSAGRAIEDSVHGVAKSQGSAPVVSGGQLPGGGGAGGGRGGGTAYGALELLTPTEGVDFTNYLARVYASVKQSWYAVMPQSVFLGDKGVVVLQFKIMRDGGVPAGEPELLRGSGKGPLDHAAFSSVRASNPFQPLPSAFSGPYIELRFTYLYNVPIEYVK